MAPVQDMIKQVEQENLQQTIARSRANPGALQIGGTVRYTADGLLPPTEIKNQAYTGTGVSQDAQNNLDAIARQNQAVIDSKANQAASNKAAIAAANAPVGSTPTRYDASGNVSGPGSVQTPQGIMSADEYAAKFGPKPVDEASIRERVRSENQGRIDAINAAYDAMAGEQQVKNISNMGSTRAITARSGLLGSDFGNAALQNQDQAGNKAMAAINAEKADRIAATLADVNTKIDQKIQAERDAAKMNANDYKNYYDKAQSEVKDSIKNLGASGISFDQLKEKDPSQLKKILDATGMSEFQLAMTLNSAKKASEKIDWKIEKVGNVVIASGVNPLTGKLEYQTQELPAEFANNDVKEVNGVLWSINPDGKTATMIGGKEKEVQLDTSVIEVNGKKVLINNQSGEQIKTLGNAKDPNASGLDPATSARVYQLANAFDSKPIVQEFNTMQESLAAVKAYKESPSSTNDQALIYAFAKAMDPTSVVREGEYATVQKYAQSWATKLGFDAKRMLADDPMFLSDTARQNIIDTVNTKFGVKEKQYNNLVDEFGRKINKITGSTDGTSYLTNYSGAFDDTSQPTSEEMVQLRKDFPGMSDEEILQNTQGFNNDQSTSLNYSNNGLAVDNIGSAGITNLGELSSKYESGGDPGSIGYDQTGGYSYGTYQLAHNNAKSFIDQSPYANEFKGLTFNSPAWRAKWQATSQKDPQGFEQAQHDYIAKTHFEPQIQKLAQAGLQIDKISPVLENVIWSTAVQHGPNNDIIVKALKSLNKNATQADLIKKIYALRWNGGMNFASSTPAVRKSVRERFFGPNGEMNTALSMLG